MAHDREDLAAQRALRVREAGDRGEVVAPGLRERHAPVPGADPGVEEIAGLAAELRALVAPAGHEQGDGRRAHQGQRAVARDQAVVEPQVVLEERMPQGFEVEQAGDRDAGLHHGSRQAVIALPFREGGHGRQLAAGGMAADVDVLRIAVVLAAVAPEPDDRRAGLAHDLVEGHGRAQGVVDDRHGHPGGHRPAGDEAEVPRRQDAPVAAVQEDQDGRVRARGREHVEILVEGRAVAEVEPGVQAPSRGVAAFRVLPDVAHEVGHGAFDVVLGVGPGAGLEVPVERRHVAVVPASAGRRPGPSAAGGPSRPGAGGRAIAGRAASRR